MVITLSGLIGPSAVRHVVQGIKPGQEHVLTLLLRMEDGPVWTKVWVDLLSMRSAC